MNWSLEDSKEIYGLKSQDLDFLDINPQGDLEIKILEKKISIVRILDLIREEVKIGSFTLRLPQLVEQRVFKIINTTEEMSRRFKFTGKFQPLYPIKVNQHKLMVRSILASHPSYGLEAGTKSELILILKALKEERHRLIMCNGTKDKQYVSIVKEAIEEGYNIIFSIETVQELLYVLDIIPVDNIRLILRIKPYVRIHGYWGSSAGRNSKFGVGVAEILEIIDILTKRNKQFIVRGIHAHPGSQVTAIEDLEHYTRFLTNVYVQLVKQGFENLNIINLGGGMPIDYESNIEYDIVIKYFEQAYKSITEILDNHGIEHPNLMIEAGRAITAHSSLIVVKPIFINYVFPNEKKQEWKKAEELLSKIEKIQTHDDLDFFIKSWNTFCVTPTDHDLTTIYKTEYYTGQMLDRVRTHLVTIGIELDLDKYRRVFKAKQYLLGNFSIFNSAADHVVVDQYFPVMVCSKLHIQPETICRLVDLTCDSDGEISSFAIKSGKLRYTKDGYPVSGRDGYLKGFPIPPIDLLKTRVIIPLLGGYQDIIEFDHNLIGDLPDVELRQIDDGFEVNILTQAEKISDLVKTVGYIIENDDNPYFDD